MDDLDRRIHTSPLCSALPQRISAVGLACGRALRSQAHFLDGGLSTPPLTNFGSLARLGDMRVETQ